MEDLTGHWKGCRADHIFQMEGLGGLLSRSCLGQRLRAESQGCVSAGCCEADGAEVALSGLKERLMVWCCSAYLLSQVTGDKDPVAQPQAGLWHLQVHPLLGLHLTRVLPTAGLLPAQPRDQSPVFSHTLGRMGRVSSYSFPCLSAQS